MQVPYVSHALSVVSTAGLSLGQSEQAAALTEPGVTTISQRSLNHRQKAVSGLSPFLVATFVVEQRVCPPMLAERNAKHQELRCRNIGYFTDKWHHPGNWEANAQKPELPDGL